MKKLKASLAIKVIACIVAVNGLATASFGSLVAIDFDSADLYSLDKTTGVRATIGNTGIDLPGSLVFRESDGMLYSVGVDDDTLYRIDPTNGNAVAVGPSEVTFEGALAIAPDGTAYATHQGSAGNPILLEIDLDNGNLTQIGTISGGNHDINGMVYRSADDMLIGLDRETNSLLLIDPTDASSGSLQALSADVGSVGGMTAHNGIGFFVTSDDELWTFDLSNGDHSLVATLSDPNSVQIGGLAALPKNAIPEPTTAALGLMGMAGLIMRRRKVA